MDRRLFFALWPDENLREQFSHIPLDAVLCGCGRRVSAVNLHVTLVYLGQMNEARLTQVLALADQVSTSVFTLQFDYLDYWQKPRVVWVGAKCTPLPLVNLVEQLTQGAQALGFDLDKRPYVPHVTLWRKVTDRPLFPEIEALRWPASSYSLVNSITSSNESHYQVLKTWQFTGG